jgi:hypothetical protein
MKEYQSLTLLMDSPEFRDFANLIVAAGHSRERIEATAEYHWGLECHFDGPHLAMNVKASRALRPAMIVVSRGIQGVAPSARISVVKGNVTINLFEAGTHDVAGEGEGTFIRIKSQDRSLRL